MIMLKLLTGKLEPDCLILYQMIEKMKLYLVCLKKIIDKNLVQWYHHGVI